MSRSKAILDSRRKLQETPFKYIPQEAEGGCGVVGLVASRPIRGSHILSPLQQMHNRGNGKGGGISAVGLVPEQLGVDKKTLEQDYLVQVAYLNEGVREELEKDFIHSTYDVHSSHRVATSDDPALLGRLEVTPPVVHRYFCRAKKDVLGPLHPGERAATTSTAGTPRTSWSIRPASRSTRSTMLAPRCPPSSCPMAGTCSS